MPLDGGAPPLFLPATRSSSQCALVGAVRIPPSGTPPFLFVGQSMPPDGTDLCGVHALRAIRSHPQSLVALPPARHCRRRRHRNCRPVHGVATRQLRPPSPLPRPWAVRTLDFDSPPSGRPQFDSQTAGPTKLLRRSWVPRAKKNAAGHRARLHFFMISEFFHSRESRSHMSAGHHNGWQQ